MGVMTDATAPPDGFPINTLAAAAAVPLGWMLARQYTAGGEWTRPFPASKQGTRDGASPGDIIVAAKLDVPAIGQARVGEDWWPEALDDPLPTFEPGAAVTVSWPDHDERQHGQVVDTLADGHVVVGRWSTARAESAPDAPDGSPIRCPFAKTITVHPAWLTDGWDDGIAPSGLTWEAQAEADKRAADVAATQAALRDLPPPDERV